MSILSTLSSWDHTFTNWVAKSYQAFHKEEPSLVALADRVFPYAKAAIQIGISFESPAVAALAGPVLDKIHAGLDTTAGILYDFGPSPTVSNSLSILTADLGSLETVAGIKSDAAKNAISKTANSLQALNSAVSGAIQAVTPA